MAALHLGTGLSRFSRCSAGLALVLLAACNDPVAARFELGQALAVERFGEDGRLAVVIDSGRLFPVDSADGEIRVDSRASGPFPDLTFDNGTTDEVVVDVAVRNVDPTSQWIPSIGPLPSTGARDPACNSDTYAGRPEVLLAAVEVTVDGPTEIGFSLTVPRCTRVRVESGPAPDVEQLTIAVVGAVNGDPEYLEHAGATAVAADADYVQFLGNLGFADDRSPFEGFRAAADATGLPYGTTVGARDARTAGESLVRQFGQADYLALLGRVRLLVLDTGNARLSDQQMAMVEDVDASRQPGFVATYQSPLSFGTTDGLRSDHQAGRLISALARRGFADMIVTGGPSPGHRTIGGLTIRDVGTGGRDGEDRRLALVTVSRPTPAMSPCVTSGNCAGGEACERGFCRRACRSDAECADGDTCRDRWCTPACSAASDCPGPLPECADGACLLDPTIAVEAIAF